MNNFIENIRSKKIVPGILDSMIDNYNDCLEVWYQRRSSTKSPAILLSTDYDKDCVGAVDSIFSDIDSLKHFEILRFQKPERLFS